VNASIFTLTAIAVDRYKAIIYPLRSHASKFRTKGMRESNPSFTSVVEADRHFSIFGKTNRFAKIWKIFAPKL
jgi:hypothetical protein